jgi:exodeoxyribonuclease VII small subunit
MPDAPDGLTFEQAERELADVVARLERGDVGLDEAIELWKRGDALQRHCAALLDAAEGRIERLTTGAVEPEPE